MMPNRKNKTLTDLRKFSSSLKVSIQPIEIAQFQPEKNADERDHKLHKLHKNAHNHLGSINIMAVVALVMLIVIILHQYFLKG